MILRDLLFEIGTEEIPAGFMAWAIKELDGLARAGLDELRLSYGDVKVTGTPRRIVLYVKDLPDRQEDLEEAVKGPPKTQSLDSDGGFTKAALGFAKSRGVEAEDLRFEAVKGVDYLFATVRESGRVTRDLLPDFLTGLIKKLTFPKSMYWDDSKVRFARPVRWIVALFDTEIVPVCFGAVMSGAKSRGHRFMGAASVEITSAEAYASLMEQEHVIVDHKCREAMIRERISEIEKEAGGVVDLDEELLAENAQLVEYPVPFRGSFEASFLDIPEEVLIATMKKNQRYFPVRGADGKLRADFIGVSNNKARDMAVVRDGNERVLRARLSDAEFFWKEDRKQKLESRLPALEKVLYQVQLGSIRDKSERTRKLAAWLVGELGMHDIVATVDRAALLAKADLVTGMVFEFPEVQGVMGREYAKREGEDARVADAIFEQYLPRFAGDELPKGREGAVIGICDRVDSIIGIHKVDLAPTGSQDPYALRRAARGINEIIWGLGLDVDLEKLFACSADLLGADEAVMDKVRAFYKQRLHVQLRERGYSHGTTSLVVESMGLRPLQALRMLAAFDEVSGEAWFTSLVQSAIRVNNILSKLPESDLTSLAVDAAKLSEDAENGLLKSLDEQNIAVKGALAENDWKAVCESLSKLAPAISGFFDGVMVMADDEAVRNNRLALLVRARELFDSIGDFSLLK